MSVRVLLAGFQDAKRSGKAAQTMLLHAARAGEAQEELEGARVQVIRIPFAHTAATAVVAALRRSPVDYFLLVGTDRSSSEYKLHVFAANYADDPRGDDQGDRLQDTILDPTGPVAYRSRLPLDGLWDKFLVERVPVRMSHKAGVWVYNHVFYDVMRAVDTEAMPTRCGALEVPPLAGEEEGDAEGRTREQLEEELHMLLAVLSQLDPAVDRDDDRKNGSQGAAQPRQNH